MPEDNSLHWCMGKQILHELDQQINTLPPESKVSQLLVGKLKDLKKDLSQRKGFASFSNEELSVLQDLLWLISALCRDLDATATYVSLCVHKELKRRKVFSAPSVFADSGPSQKPRCSTRRRLEKARELAIRYPELSDRQIAAATGLHPSSLSRDKQYQQIRKHQRAQAEAEARERYHRGYLYTNDNGQHELDGMDW